MERQKEKSERYRKLREMFNDDDNDDDDIRIRPSIAEQIRLKQEEVSRLEQNLRQKKEDARLLEESRLKEEARLLEESRLKEERRVLGETHHLKDAESRFTDSMLPSTSSVTKGERTDEIFCGPCERKLNFLK